MKTKLNRDFTRCLNFVQVSMFTLFSLVFTSVYSKEINQSIRKPASTPEEEVLTMPTFDRPLILTIFAEDDAGVMASMRNDLNYWEQREEYAKRWNLKSTGLYNTPTLEAKRNMISSRLLKYADKRLAGEMKNAKEGSTLYTVGKVEKTLRPNAEVSVSKNINLKFKARVLEGKMLVIVQNPWVDCSSTLTANGKVKVSTKKEFAELGLSTGLELTANNTEWIAYADQKINENISARVSSSQKDQSLFNHDAEKKLEMNATFPLNF